MNKEEIMEVLSEKSFSNNCIYCGEEVKRGYYAEDDLGKKLIFPKYLIGDFMEEEREIPIHYKCLKSFILDMMKETEGKLNGTGDDTKVIIRY